MSVDVTRNGPAQAATLSVGCAALVAACVRLAAVPGGPCASALAAVAAVLPGGAQAGEFAALQAIFLSVWLIVWIVLDRALARRELPVGVHQTLFLASLGLATTLWWPPVAEALRARWS
ncbi:MAG: hypothetical protein MOGMAGMI_00167 [Candidatus Omnitrophica bacterium]|nr:hypothetical protein [Candidatus Omnitrophota bacterium]